MTHGDVFIVGAGFSKAIDCWMPTMEELTMAVMEQITNDELSLPLPLMDSEGRGRELGTNIEFWMTYLTQQQPWLDQSSNQQNQGVATQIRKYIGNVIPPAFA